MRLKIYRITTFVPPGHLDKVLAGILRVVPLQHGRYDQVAWWSAEGVEQFRPLPGANPTEGTEDRLSRVASIRLEFTIPRQPELLDRVLDEGLIPSHPWEEPAIFIDEAVVTLTAGKDSAAT